VYNTCCVRVCGATVTDSACPSDRPQLITRLSDGRRRRRRGLVGDRGPLLTRPRFVRRRPHTPATSPWRRHVQTIWPHRENPIRWFIFFLFFFCRTGELNNNNNTSFSLHRTGVMGTRFPDTDAHVTFFTTTTYLHSRIRLYEYSAPRTTLPVSRSSSPVRTHTSEPWRQ